MVFRLKVTPRALAQAAPMLAKRARKPRSAPIGPACHYTEGKPAAGVMVRYNPIPAEQWSKTWKKVFGVR